MSRESARASNRYLWSMHAASIVEQRASKLQRTRVFGASQRDSRRMTALARRRCRSDVYVGVRPPAGPYYTILYLSPECHPYHVKSGPSSSLNLNFPKLPSSNAFTHTACCEGDGSLPLQLLSELLCWGGGGGSGQLELGRSNKLQVLHQSCK